jgi:hypothetical protein
MPEATSKGIDIQSRKVQFKNHLSMIGKVVWARAEFLRKLKGGVPELHERSFDDGVRQVLIDLAA